MIWLLFCAPPLLGFAWFIRAAKHAPAELFWWRMDLDEYARWLKAGQPDETTWQRIHHGAT